VYKQKVDVEHAGLKVAATTRKAIQEKQHVKAEIGRIKKVVSSFLDTFPEL